MIAPEDRALIEEIARAKDSSPLPAMGIGPALERLIALGVMPRPADTADWGTVVDSARESCKRWVAGATIRP